MKKKVFFIIMLSLFLISSVFAQTATKQTGSKISGGSKESTSGTSSKTQEQKSIPSSIQEYDLSVEDIQLDRDNKVCLILKNLVGVIPEGDFRKIKLSVETSSLPNLPAIELSRIDPNRQLNSLRRIEFNTGYILTKPDTVTCTLKDLQDKNNQNNSLKKRLTPTGIPSKEVASQKPTHEVPKTETVQREVLGGSRLEEESKVPKIPVKGAVKKIPTEDRQGLTPLSLPLPDVANILQLNRSTVSPLLWEVPFDNYSLESFRLDWNQFAFSDFKQITLRILYLGESREWRVDERTFRKDGPNTYSVGLRAIFDWLTRNRAISSAEAWKIYRFKISGTVTLNQGQSQTSSGGLSQPSGQAQSMRQTTSTSSQEKVIPTNSFIVDLFLKGREEAQVSPPSSGQVAAGIRFATLPPNSEGRFKIILDSYLPEDLRNCHWVGGKLFCDLGCFIRSVFLENFNLTIENARNPNEKCVVSNVGGFNNSCGIYPNQRGSSIRTGQGTSDPGCYFMGVESEQSLTNLLQSPGCRNINPQGKTFRIWGQGRMRISYVEHSRITRDACKEDSKSKEFSVYSPQAVYVTLYPEGVVQDLQQQTQTPVMSPQAKPSPLKLEHPMTTISTPWQDVQGAKIDFSQALRVNWSDSARAFPSGMETVIEIRKVPSNELISSPGVREGSSAEIRPSSGRASIAGGFPAGTYMVNHAFCYPYGSPLNPSSTIPLCTAYSDPVYFQSNVPISKVNLQLSDFQLTPRNSHHGLKVRLYNLSSQTLTRDYVSGIRVSYESPSGGNTAFTIPTPIPGRAGEASQPAFFELPSHCDILSHLDKQTITLRIEETELWGPASITQTFTVPQRERSNLSFDGGLAFLRSNDGKQITVNFRVKEELRGRANIYIPYKIKFRVSKAGGHIIHEEEFERQPSLGGPWPMSFLLNKDDILRKSGGERHLAVEVILDWEGKYAESNENDNRLSSWYDF